MPVGWLPSSYRSSRGQGSEGEEWQLLHMLSTGRGRGLDRDIGGIVGSGCSRLHHMTCGLFQNPVLPPPLPSPVQRHSCQTGKTNQLWLLFPINHGIMQTGNSNKMQTSGKTGAPNQISHLHPAASLPDQTLLATPVTPAEVAPNRDGERVFVGVDGQ